MTRKRYAIQMIIEEETSSYDPAGTLIETIKDCVLIDLDDHYLISASSEDVYEDDRVRPLLVVPDD